MTSNAPEHNQPDDDEIEIIDDTAEIAAGDFVEPWRLLVVDDDPTVHEVTRIALSDFEFQGRKLAILNAYSAEEGFAMLANPPWPAVMLLDVVMETDDAGLRLAQRVRDEAQNRLTRIVLRTGQPGQAPERRVIAHYDINDYKSKTELTADRLYVTMCSALRAYDQIAEIEDSRGGLKVVVGALETLQKANKASRFGRRAIRQFATLLGLYPDGIFCVRPAPEHDGDLPHVTVIAGHGRYADLTGRALTGLGDADLRTAVRAAYGAEAGTFGPERTSLYFETPAGRRIVTVLDGHANPSAARTQALDVLFGNAATAFDNLMYVGQIARQAEVLEIKVAARTAELADANEALTRLAATDALTGTLNRRAFFERGEAELSRARRAERVTTILALDIDHFKSINDRFGHPGGDAALKAFANVLKRETRVSDMVARLGGEEFAILLPETGLDKAVMIGERIRVAIAALVVSFEGRDIHFTVSTGVAHCPPGCGSLEGLLAAADGALYEAKNTGRNRVVCAKNDAGTG